MKTITLLFKWLCQIGAGSVFIYAAISKFKGSPMDIETFKLLDMEPTGRIMIGICEIIAGAGLFHPLSAAHAALLGAGVLTGASLAHVGVLGSAGINLLLPTYFATLVVVIMRRHELFFSVARQKD